MVVLLVIFLLLFVTGAYLVLLLIPCILAFGFFLASIICSIFYYIMGKEAGFDLPWIAFFPGGKNYIAFTIPHREFNLGFFSTFNRKLIFWIWFATEILVYLISAVGSVYIFLSRITSWNILRNLRPLCCQLLRHSLSLQSFL